jgi:hypothetical protein
MNKKILYMCGMLLATMLTGCKNGDAEFSDYEKGVSVYFANQYPVRTLVMGEDEYDTSLDNAHKCQIQATMGGSYTGKDITLQLEIDEALCNHLYFNGDDSDPVVPMPRAYYDLSSTTMHYQGFRGIVEVQLNDAFFNDPEALNTHYVIPVKIKDQVGASRVLRGTPIEEGTDPQHTWAAKWMYQPQDFVLYAVKYISKYDVNYLRRGVDVINANGTTTKVARPRKAEPKDQERVMDVNTLSLNSVEYPVSFKISNETRTCKMILTFDPATNKCNITTADATVATITGTGEYKEKSELAADKTGWGNKDRDGLYLDYKVQFADGVTCETKDSLTWMSRGVAFEEFVPVYK